jgi:DNA-binding Xre family transcriptional regulator
MVYWRVAEQLKARKWSRYRLVQESGLPATTIYRLAKSGREVQRVDGHTLDVLCATLGCQPGDLLEFVPEKKRKTG